MLCEKQIILKDVVDRVNIHKWLQQKCRGLVPHKNKYLLINLVIIIYVKRDRCCGWFTTTIAHFSWKQQIIVCIVWQGGWITRQGEFSLSPRRVDFIDTREWWWCSCLQRCSQLCPGAGESVRCSWRCWLVTHCCLEWNREKVSLLSHGEVSHPSSVSMLLMCRWVDEPQVCPISPWWLVSRCSSWVSRATLMWTRDACHTDRPAEADQIRERLSALELAALARCCTRKLKSWSARNHRVTLVFMSLARDIHWRGIWSITWVNLRPRR